MDIYTAAKYMKLGYRIRRAHWLMMAYLYDIHGHLWIYGPYGSYGGDQSVSISLSLSDLLANDWEIITEGIVKNFPITYQE